MTSNTRGVHLAGNTLRHCCHACAFFRDREEEFSVLLPFAREGFDRGDRLFQIVDARHRPERLRGLADAGMAADEADPAGQVEVRPWEEAYQRGGRFNQDAAAEPVLRSSGPDAAGDARSRVIHDGPRSRTPAIGDADAAVSLAWSRNARGVKPA